MTIAFALLVAMLLSALGGALALTTLTERQTASSYDRSAEALYAADGAAELAIQDLAGIADWSQALDGTVRSPFVDGPPGGARVLADGTALDLTRISSANTPQMALFAYGPMEAWLPAPAIRSPIYVVAWVGDDAADGDGQRLVDSNNTVTLLVHAYGVAGSRRVVEVTVARVVAGLRIVAWRELRS